MSKIAIIGHGRSVLAAIAAQSGMMDRVALSRVQTCNKTPEEIAERDRPISRQERRQAKRLAKKNRHVKEPKS